MDCIVHRVAKNRTQLSNFHFTFPFSFMCNFSINMHSQLVVLNWLSSKSHLDSFMFYLSWGINDIRMHILNIYAIYNLCCPFSFILKNEVFKI